MNGRKAKKILQMQTRHMFGFVNNQGLFSFYHSIILTQKKNISDWSRLDNPRLGDALTFVLHKVPFLTTSLKDVKNVETFSQRFPFRLLKSKT
jgi:hypothetical protein